MLRLHHIALGAHNVRRVADFYRAVFGLSEQKIHFEGDGTVRSVWLSLDDGVLMIERSDQVTTRAPSGVGLGPFLLAFATSEEQRKHYERTLAEHGAVIEARTTHTSYARDPEGNRVAISSYPLDLPTTERI